jgi:hypothetical protein
MPLKKLTLKPGVNRENTRYTTEGGWYESDKIRFRQGTPEKIGGWERISENFFLGVCRSLHQWSTLEGVIYTGVGTNLKFYVESGGAYYDITPIAETNTLTNPFDTLSGESTVTVTDAGMGNLLVGDFVTFSGATAVGGLTINGEYQITSVDQLANTYTIDAGTPASSTATGGGTVSAAYQISVGAPIVVPLTGWGSSTWGSGTWGVGAPSTTSLRLWSQSNFGEDLIFGPRGGAIYYWDASAGLATRAVNLADVGGASDVPTKQNFLLISDVSRFVFAMGCEQGGVFDAMLIRWSDQEDATNWTPSATNQASFLRLSRGSEIVTATQSRQEILVWTDTSLYSLQYVGAPVVWGAQLVGENTSIASENAVAYANGVAYWMGVDKFYKYDGRTQTLRCDLRQFVFNNLNPDQYDQVFAGTNEAFNEIWWFYCSTNSTISDSYVVYNYAEDIWYYGLIGRTAWVDSGITNNPVAATYSSNLVAHEVGNDNAQDDNVLPIEAFILSSEFDLDDGHNFMFIWRMLPDVSFARSTAANPAIAMTLLPMANSGSGYNDPASVGSTNFAPVVRSATVPIEKFTGQVFVRVRGRQMAIRISSDALGVAWQLGSPRLDMRADGRR